MARKTAPTRYVAFLRGINLGKRRVKMESLRDLFAALGFADVSTYIASGNVLFDAPAGDPAAIEARIEAHLKASLGYEVETFLRTPAELAAIVAFRPFEDAELEAPGHTLHVGFLRGAVGDEAEAKMRSFRTAMDDFRFLGRELYWLCRGKVTDSLVSWPAVTKAVRLPSTLRNVTTVRKLAAMVSPG